MPFGMAEIDARELSFTLQSILAPAPLPPPPSPRSSLSCCPSCGKGIRLPHRGRAVAQGTIDFGEGLQGRHAKRNTDTPILCPGYRCASCEVP